MRYWPVLGLDFHQNPSPWKLISLRICIIPYPRKFRFWNGDRGPGNIDPRHRNAAIPAVRRWKRSCRIPSVEHMDRIAPLFAGRNANRPIGPRHVDPTNFVHCYLTPVENMMNGIAFLSSRNPTGSSRCAEEQKAVRYQG